MNATYKNKTLGKYTQNRINVPTEEKTRITCISKKKSLQIFDSLTNPFHRVFVVFMSSA